MKKLSLLLSGLFLILQLAACGEELPGSDPPPSGTATDALFRALSPLSQPDPLSSPETVGAPLTNLQGDTLTVTTRYRAAPGFDELICMAPGSDTLWPGAILFGNSIPTGEYLPVIAARAPLTFSVSLINMQGNISRTVTTPSLSKVRQAVADLLTQNITGSTPARTAFSVSDVYNEDQLQIAIGGNYGSGVFSVKSQFDFNNKQIRSRVLVKFVQVYYTIDIDLPAAPTALFVSPAAASNVLASCGGTSPLYISSVSYGRLALFSFESGEDNEEMKVAISAAFNGLTAKGEVSLSIRQQELLRTAVIKATIIGGNGGMAVHTINGLEGLKAYVLTGGNFNRDNPGAPLAYRFRYLSDNATCRIVFASEYEIIRTEKALARFRITNLRLHCDGEDDAGSSAEFYGNCQIQVRTGETYFQYVPGSWDGTIRDNTLWQVQEFLAGFWELGAGDAKAIPGGRDYVFSRGDLEHAVCIITANIRENDPTGDDNLGTRSLNVPLKDIGTEQTFTLGGFVDGGTRARITFTVSPM